MMATTDTRASTTRAGELPEACRARGDYARELAARNGIGSRISPDIPGARGRLAYALAWDAYAAAEYPRPMMGDGVDCDLVAPEHAARVWHHIAGAVILQGPPWDCGCATPAGHRDALADIAREIRADGGES